MSKIRSKNTQFELNFITLLKETVSISFSTHVRNIRGTPDIVFNKQKVCIFLDSDFWHGWQFPRWRHLMKNEFWVIKIVNNRNRDRRVTKYLRRNGWVVKRIWEHEIASEKKEILHDILRILKSK